MKNTSTYINRISYIQSEKCRKRTTMAIGFTALESKGGENEKVYLCNVEIAFIN